MMRAGEQETETMASGTEMEKSALGISGPSSFGDRMSGVWSRARVQWAAMKPSQRGWLITALVMLVGLLGWLAWYSLRTDWRTLYANLEPEDARQTGMILTQAQIPFETTTDGTGILVPYPQLDKARLATAAKGSLKSGRLGFEIFDKPNWVGSEFDEQVNYQRALEGELEHTVGSLSDVLSARVHLVMPHDSLFRDQERPAKASVVIKLRHRTLADGEPDAIRNLVSSAVDGLTPDRVVLVDAAGNMPLGPKTEEAMRLSAEQILEEKLIATLEPVTGPGNVRASVTLDYDSSATEETQERYDPDQTVTLSMQRSEQTSGGQQVAAGVPGTASNAPNSQSLPVYPQQTTPPQSAKTESGTYGASKTVRHMIESPGRVRRMTAAIVVNDRMAQGATKGKAPQWQQRTPDEIRNLTALAQAAVGYDNTRGDMLTVQDLAFDENRSLQPVTFMGQLIDQAEKSPLLTKYAAILLALLVILFFGVQPALRRARPPKPAKQPKLAKDAKDSKEAKELPGTQAVGTPILATPEPVELDPARVRAQEIFEAVTGHLKREPTQSSRLLQSWIHSE
jgi:flagellar M-ring protein FliF